MRILIDNGNTPAAPRPYIGHYGRLRKAYLEQSRPDLYTALVANEKLHEHCAEIDEAARSRIDLTRTSSSRFWTKRRAFSTVIPTSRGWRTPICAIRPWRKRRMKPFLPCRKRSITSKSRTLPASSCICWTRKASCSPPSARQKRSWTSTWTARSASMRRGRALPARLNG